GRALVGVYAMRVRDLARVVAEPAVLGAGLRAWLPGHPARIADRLLAERRDAFHLDPGLPRGPVAAALARTLSALRLGGVDPRRVAALASREGTGVEDADRLASLADVYAAYQHELDGRFADPATLLGAAI